MTSTALADGLRTLEPPDNLADEPHRLIVNAIRGLANDNLGANPATACLHLARYNQLQDIGGSSNLTNLSEMPTTSPAALNLERNGPGSPATSSFERAFAPLC